MGLMPETPWYEKELNDQVVLMITTEQKEMLKEQAELNQISLSQMIRFACNYWLERVEETNSSE